MTHLFNEYYDYESDCKNVKPSPWTGGSRVLVQGLLRPETALIAGLIFCFGLTAWTLFFTKESA